MLWEAETEIADISPSGERWQADVLACKNGLRVAIEMQWSSQANEDCVVRSSGKLRLQYRLIGRHRYDISGSHTLAIGLTQVSV